MSSSRKANYRLSPTREFLKNLERLDRQTNQRIISSIEGLSVNPFLGKSLRGELKGLYSLRIGKYRVILLSRHKEARNRSPCYQAQEQSLRMIRPY
ncbi:MAG: type II toxin-antitoxin system RelE/ParE family toxin [Thaumarchaeota archaeon]|nr:type II toxin-antitoxin system RelE/ParE family toxin [Nitrososphaerota archaeon]